MKLIFAVLDVSNDVPYTLL